MISYQSGIFGLRNLLHMHGSPVYKVIIPTALSTGFLVIIQSANTQLENEKAVQHPYTIGAFIGFFSFLLTFRLNFAYQRYWEGATSVHQMLSKWLDVAMTLAAWHYQSRSYDSIKPPAFGLNPLATPDNMPIRPHAMQPSYQEMAQQIQKSASEQSTSWYHRFRIRKLNELEKMQLKNKRFERKVGEFSVRNDAHVKYINASKSTDSTIPVPSRFRGGVDDESNNKEQERNVRSALTRQARQSLRLVRNRPTRMPAPSLFLQELAHLSSLLCAVAMSTLRNDLEMAESPLCEYIPGEPWPPVDPDKLSKDTRHEYGEDNMVWTVIYFCLGLSRSKKHRTLYNAARPFTVLGGVSDEEVMFLQNARGPYAKTALCFMWLQEFISRETLLGSTGDINGAILSRLFQYQSDGMVGYNAARKIAYVPFPFVNAQITAFFSLSIIFVFPFLYLSFVNQFWFACFMNSLTVLCFLGLHEVGKMFNPNTKTLYGSPRLTTFLTLLALELENPFINAPNDLPLCTFQAQYNEALGTMFSGYHPDSWFTVETENATSPDD